MKQQLLKIRHEKSQKDFPQLDLRENEFVELEFTRAAICTVLIWILASFAAVILLIFLIIFNQTGGNLLIPGVNITGFVNLVGIVFFGIIAIAALVSTRVFAGNRLYVTNQRAIQYTMISLFGSSVNVIELEKIEDVSFKQSGIFEYIFGIGTIRMSTVGDETTYTFKLAYKPSSKEMKTLLDLVDEKD